MWGQQVIALKAEVETHQISDVSCMELKDISKNVSK